MVNREHFLKSDGGWCGGGEYWTAVAIPTSLCWLRASARSSLCIYFSSTFQHCVHLLSEAAQSHIWCDRCAQHMRTAAGMPQPLNSSLCQSAGLKPEENGTLCRRTKLYSYPQRNKQKKGKNHAQMLFKFLNFAVCLFIKEQYDFSIEDIYTFKQQTIRGRWLLPPSLPTGN